MTVYSTFLHLPSLALATGHSIDLAAAFLDVAGFSYLFSQREFISRLGKAYAISIYFAAGSSAVGARVRYGGSRYITTLGKGNEETHLDLG